MDWVDDAARQLERVLGDPLADSMRGAVRIVRASEPKSRGKYQECELVVVTEADGIPETLVRTAVVTSLVHWPRVGAVLPALISRTDPTRIEVDWDALAR
ncbi:hypothetical protein [Microbacterium sp.]|uniref:hypothetical protein n=1 Tax=Microbacterium sp. TaxID=51671 RepID=UPI003C760708